MTDTPRGTGPKLLDQVARAVRARRYSPRTEEAYVGWVRRFVRYHGLRHPEKLGAREVNAFLTHLAVDRAASRSTQGQARAALLFLYREVLRKPLEELDEDIVKGKAPRTLPTVLTRRETARVLDELQGTPKVVCGLLYGSGLRLLEALQLRVRTSTSSATSSWCGEGRGRVTGSPSYRPR